MQKINAFYLVLDYRKVKGYTVFLQKKYRIKGRIRRSGFLCIFTVAFLLYLAPGGGGFNPSGYLLTLT